MTKQYQLKNGLQVLLIESHKSPVVSLQAWVRTGSADEIPKEAGISHFIEHLLFKGTEKFKVGEIAQIIEGSGGELNAYTSFDQTVFYMTLSRNYLRTGLEALSQMMGHPEFDPAEINAEREVVVEEMRRGMDSLGRNASQLLFKTAYGTHPYGRPVIGFEKIIRKVSPQTIRSYFEGRYNPKNMFLVISGDFELRETKEIIQEFFGQLQSFPVRKVRRPKVAKALRPKVKVETSKFEQSIAYLAWPVPKISHADIPALDLLAFVLGMGETSRLVHRLRMREPLVQSVGASTFTPSDEGLFLISAGFADTNPELIFQAIREEVMNIVRDGVSPAEIQRAVTNLQSDEFYSLETVDGLARKFGNLEFHFRDLKVSERYLKIMRGLTSADLQRVARKYLRAEATVAVGMQGLKSRNLASAMKKFVADFRKDLRDTSIRRPAKAVKIKHPAVPRFKSERRAPATELIELANGDRVLYRPSFDTPVVSVRVASLGGVRAEPSNHGGLCELVTRTWAGGTSRYSELEISEKVEGLAAGLSPMGGKNSLSLGADVLSTSIKPMSALWAEILSGPTFPQEVIDRERQIQLHQIAAKKDNPAQICMQLFAQGMFGAHAYSRDSLGTPNSLASLTRDQLSDWWMQNFRRRKKSIAICGATDVDAWIRAYEETIEAGAARIPDPVSKRIEYPSAPVSVFERVEKEQSHMVYGFPGLTLFDERRYALQLMQSVLAGQGGRLFLELRDKNSLAYSVSPLRMEGIDGGYFGAYIGCAPSKTETALRMMAEEFKKLCDELIPEAELERAKRYIIGRHDIDLQRASSISAAILFNDLYGIDYNETFTSGEKFRQVTAEQIRELARTIFGQPGVVSVVGPRALEQAA